jgi:hypothetical protein
MIIYVSFGQLIVNMSPDDLFSFYKLFNTKFIYYETDADLHHQTLDKDKAEIGISLIPVRISVGPWNAMKFWATYKRRKNVVLRIN